MPYSLGQTVRQPILCRVNFERINPSRTEEQITKARQAVPNYFRLNRAWVDGLLSEIRDLHAAVKAADTFEKYQQTHSAAWPLDAAAFGSLKALSDEAGSARFKRAVDAIAARIVQEELVEKADIEREDVRSTAAEVQLDRGDGTFSPWPKEKLTYAINSEHVDALAEALVRDLFTPETRPAIRAIIKHAIVPAGWPIQPVYLFDRDFTKTMMAQAESIPPVKDSFRIGDQLLKTGVIDGEDIVLLRDEHDEFQRQRTSNPELHGSLVEERIGLLGLVGLVTIGLAIYGYRCQPRAVTKTPRAIGIAALILLMLLGDRFVLVGIGSSPIWSVSSIAMTAAILTISYSQLFALGGTAALALLVVIMHDAPTGMLLIFLTVASVTTLLLNEIRTRLKMVEVGGITALTAALSTVFVGFTLQHSFRFMAKEAAFAALAALAGISIILVLLPIIERAFRITTSLTLLEWADTSRPLLRQLIETAPGTWQHSHLLGSMAESAAEEIGANGLLVRVGAYYHDVGKMCKPNYFVENQAAKMNAHRGLAPTMSLLVILAHVKDGLALAREHGLPPAIHPFIAEHHGTTVVRYFHSMAAQEARAGERDDRDVSETEFRYPGPKPRSVESAILMICDGVEGSVRSLAEPTPSRIETVVHGLIMQRLMDGQFDDCDITLKELSRLEQSLVRSLCSIHHGRIAYPTAPTEEPGRPSGEPRRGMKVGA